MLLKEGQGFRLEIKPRLDSMPFHPLDRGRPDPMELLHGQGLDETWSVLRGDDRLAIGLVQVARHFGQELIVGDTGRRVEASDRLDLGSDLQRDFRGDVHTFRFSVTSR